MNSAEEKRLDSCVRTAKYLAVLRRYYNKNVKERFFMVGDLVLKWKMNQAGVHKLATPWEGPFMSRRLCDQHLTGYLTWMVQMYPIHGTSTSLGVSMLSY